MSRSIDPETLAPSPVHDVPIVEVIRRCEVDRGGPRPVIVVTRPPPRRQDRARRPAGAQQAEVVARDCDRMRDAFVERARYGERTHLEAGIPTRASRGKRVDAMRVSAL
jgi:hypothetical protein